MSQVQVQYVIDDADAGDAIADTLLRGRLVACCQKIGPITSRYWWRGELESAAEWLFLCKTTTERLTSAIDAIVRLHPYETPEIVATEIADGFGPYLRWIEAETG